MQAGLHDPIGPRWTRLFLPALALVVIVLGSTDGEPSSASFVGLALLALAGPLLGRHAPRRVELRLEDGAVRIRSAGVLTQTIGARSIVGASASVGTGTFGAPTTLAIARSDRSDHPTLLELESEQDADAIRKALGIGHFGAGSLAFHAKVQPCDRVLFVIRIVFAMGALGIAWMRVGRPEEPVVPLLMPLVGLVLAALLSLRERFDRLGHRNPEGRIVLDAKGVHYGRDTFVGKVPFEEIEHADATSEGITILRRPSRPLLLAVDLARHGRLGMSAAERAHVVDQICSAARRARGETMPRPDLAAQATLARREVDTRAWIARLDATARVMASGTEYRGNGACEAELWSALEDPDAPADVRAAAARVLSMCATSEGDASIRARETRKRIETVLARVRDRRVERRVRVMAALDAERASRALTL